MVFAVVTVRRGHVKSYGWGRLPSSLERARAGSGAGRGGRVGGGRREPQMEFESSSYCAVPVNKSCDKFL